MSNSMALRLNFITTSSEYEQQSAGVTRIIGKQILDNLPPIEASSVVHDNACGPGIITKEILAAAARSKTTPPTIHATDFTEAMVNMLQLVIDEEKLHEHVTAQVMDGSDLSKFSDKTFTHSITNFGMFAFPDPIAGAAHIRRTLKDGGVAAVTTWKYPGNVFFANEVRDALNPGMPPWFPLMDWLEEAKLPGILQAAGFAEENIDISTRKASINIDDLDLAVALFDGPFFNPAKNGMSEEQKSRWVEVVRKKLEEREGKAIDMIAWVAVAKK
jgi:ubiquinone/menaquinone biosynthesis C-methylase UbiE